MVLDNATCGFIQSSSNWIAGEMKGNSKFTSFKSAISFYKSKGHKSNAKLIQLRNAQAIANPICEVLSPFKFKTSGFVAFGITTTSAVTKSVSSQGVKNNPVPKPIGGLVGVTETGSTSAVITPVVPSDNSLVKKTIIRQVSVNSSGILYTLYLQHPKYCILGKVSPGSTVEECVLSGRNMPKGYAVGDSAGVVGETTDLMQFDSLGNVYLSVTGCPTNPSPTTLGEAILQLKGNGEIAVIGETNTCNQVIHSWTPSESGRVLFARADHLVHKLTRWEAGREVDVMSDATVNSGGIQRIPGDQFLVSLFDARDPNGGIRNPDGTPHRVQGGVLRVDENNRVSKWLHLANQEPLNSIEAVTSKWCNCSSTSSMAVLSGNGSSVFSVKDYLSSDGKNKYGLLEMYPTVSFRFEISNLLGDPSAFEISKSTGILGTVVSRGCSIIKQVCPKNLFIIDLATWEVVPVVGYSNNLSIRSIENSQNPDSYIVQAVDTLSNTYKIGVVDGKSRTVTWQDSDFFISKSMIQ